ncbi:MAG: ABC transporter ATP-binding protein, partial [Acidiferrobacterales bacterium]|nr:ABC transporter ATP-binding protein [Acidiferrobacterales bacterium]
MIRLESSGLQLRVGERVLLSGLNLRMRSGETWVILGANGSGKTTLLHTLAGLRKPDAGSVRLDGEAIEHFTHRQRARHIGILFQDYEVLFPGSVIDTVLTSRYPYSGWAQLFGDSDEDRRVASKALTNLDLLEFARRNMASLSGGERRRVQIAALAAQTVPIQLLDEPSNHLDLRHQVQVLDYIIRGKPMSPELQVSDRLNVMAIHDINLALQYGTHAILLYP